MDDELRDDTQQVIDQARAVRARADHDRDLLAKARAELAKDEADARGAVS